MQPPEAEEVKAEAGVKAVAGVKSVAAVPAELMIKVDSVFAGCGLIMSVVDCCCCWPDSGSLAFVNGTRVVRV